MTYIPNAIATIADGSISSAKLGVDITALAKDLIVQATPDDAKTTLEVTEGSGSAIVPFTF